MAARRSHFKKFILDNGLTVLTERHPEFRSLSMGMWVKAGTRHELPRVAGVSHFLEHMLFKGTATRTPLQIAQEVDRVGGEFNAFTTREYTCFHLLLLERNLSLGVDILSDVLLNSTFSEEELERERRVILQEIAGVAENPEEMLFDIYFELIYGRHGLGRPILGTANSVRRMRRQDVLQYFRTHYRPDQMIFSLAGNVDPQSLRRKLGDLKHLHWPGRPQGRSELAEAAQMLEDAPAPRPKPGLWWIPRSTEQIHLVWGVPGLPYSSKDRFAMLLLNVYLGSGMSSTLFQEIREKKGLAYTVYSSISAYADSGMFTIYAATNMSQVALCLRLIEECVAQAEREHLKESDLHMIKENLKGTILLSADDVENRMSSIAKGDIFHGEYHTPEEICAWIDQVTAADIRRVARKLFAADRSICALGPKAPRALLSKLAFETPARFKP
jgi:predicted Zn-dependent peptidase